MAGIKLENVNKTYSANNIFFENLSLEVENGEFVCLLGPTGSGKSAILRLISGLDEIDDGTLFIDGEIANDMSTKDRNVALIFQNHQLIPSSVYENIAFSLKLRSLPAEAINIKVREVARILDIEHLLNRKPKTLSALERQRVAWARALVRDPNVCMFDDSFASFDDNLTRVVRSEIVKLCYRLKQTFIYATRDQIDAMSMADKIIVLNKGKVEQVGTPKDIYTHPKTVFVATYVGSPQIATPCAKLVKNDNDYALEFNGITLAVPTEKALAMLEKGDYLGESGLTLGIRAEDMQIVTENETFTGFVNSVENYGAYKVVAVAVDSKTEWFVIASPDCEFAVNQEVKVKIATEKVHIFDQMTEENLF